MFLQNVNRSLFTGINHFAQRTPGLHGFFLFFANEGLILFMLMLFAAYLYAWRRRNLSKLATVLCTAVATIAAEGLNQPLAHTFKELRPYDTMPNILVLIHRANDYSFPSDHGVMIGAVTAGLFMVSPMLGAVSLVLGLLVAFARVYTAAHYPFDLLAGFGFGALVAFMCCALLWKPFVWVLGRLEKTPLRILLYRQGGAVADDEAIPKTSNE